MGSFNLFRGRSSTNLKGDSHPSSCIWVNQMWGQAFGVPYINYQSSFHGEISQREIAPPKEYIGHNPRSMPADFFFIFDLSPLLLDLYAGGKIHSLSPPQKKKHLALGQIDAWKANVFSFWGSASFQVWTHSFRDRQCGQVKNADDLNLNIEKNIVNIYLSLK